MRTQYENVAKLPLSLQKDAIESLAKQEVSKILEAIHRKSKESDIEFDVLFEVFKRGWYSNRGSEHLTEAEIGFNRVNSFLAGGLARRLDADLVMEAKKLSPGMLEILKHIHTHPNTQTPHNEVRGRLWKAWKQLPNDLYDASAENGYSLTPTGLEHLKKSGKLNEDMGINILQTTWFATMTNLLPARN